MAISVKGPITRGDWTGDRISASVELEIPQLDRPTILKRNCWDELDAQGGGRGGVEQSKNLTIDVHVRSLLAYMN